MAKTFLGFKQVLKSTYDATVDKSGFIWFVRESLESLTGDIYLGSRHYGHYGTEAEDIDNINTVLKEAGVVDESGHAIDIKSLIEKAQLEEGTGVTISNGVISANAEATTTEDITIAGGAIKATGLWEDDTIPQGTSIQDILTKLLCQELYPNAATKPTISLSLTSSLSGLREVYSTVTVPGVTIATNDGKFNASYTNVTQPATDVEWDNKVITTRKTGFTEYSIVSSASTVESQNDIVVSLGTNKVEYNAKGNYSAPKNVPLTNLNHEATDAAYTFVASSATNSTSVTITGVYPIFVNGISASTVDATAAAMEDLITPSSDETSVATYKMPLVSTGTGFAVSFAKQVVAPYRVLVPKNVYSINTAYAINGLTGKFENDCKNNFVANGEEVKTINGTDVTYTILEWKSTEGANRVKFVLK